MPAGSDPFVGLSIPTPPIADDDGLASSDLHAALHAASGGASGELVLAALVTARLFVPVVAVTGDVVVDERGLKQEKSSSMATVSMNDGAGRRSLLAFTSTAELSRFNDQARPVPIAAPRAAQAALAERAHGLIIDVTGEAPFAVVGAELEALAAASGGGARNLGLRAAIARLVRGEPDIVDAFLDAVDGADSNSDSIEDTACELVLVLPPSLGRKQYEQLLLRLTQQLASDRAVIAATAPRQRSGQESGQESGRGSERKGLAMRVVSANDQTFQRAAGDTPSLM